MASLKPRAKRVWWSHRPWRVLSSSVLHSPFFPFQPPGAFFALPLGQIMFCPRALHNPSPCKWLAPPPLLCSRIDKLEAQVSATTGNAEAAGLAAAEAALIASEAASEAAGERANGLLSLAASLAATQRDSIRISRQRPRRHRTKPNPCCSLLPAHRRCAFDGC